MYVRVYIYLCVCVREFVSAAVFARMSLWQMDTGMMSHQKLHPTTLDSTYKFLSNPGDMYAQHLVTLSTYTWQGQGCRQVLTPTIEILIKCHTSSI